MRTKILIIALLLIPLFVKSQDTILLKTGSKILCKITNVDSLNVYFDIEKNNRDIHTFASKASVQEIKYYNPSAIKVSSDYTNQRQYNSIALSIGPSMPVGDFSNDDVSSNSAGLAGNGLNINGIYTHYYSPNLGLVVKGFYNSNEFMANKLTDMISSETGYTVTNNSVSYTSYGLLIGITRVHHVDKLSVSGHLLLGFADLTEPETTFTIISGSNSGWIKMSEVSAASLILNIGAGLTYTLNDNWDMFANIDYLDGSFKFGSYSLSAPSGESQSTDRGTQSFGVINITVGLALKFQ